MASIKTGIMISGIGVDIIETERVAEKIAKENGFREYVFNLHEISYCESKTSKAEHYAARFAAKEALLKALGSGFPGGLALNEIGIQNNELGKPEFYFTGASKTFIQNQEIKAIHISLSHLKNIACAMVVIEK